MKTWPESPRADSRRTEVPSRAGAPHSERAKCVRLRWPARASASNSARIERFNLGPPLDCSRQLRIPNSRKCTPGVGKPNRASIRRGAASQPRISHPNPCAEVAPLTRCTGLSDSDCGAATIASRGSPGFCSSRSWSSAAAGGPAGRRRRHPRSRAGGTIRVRHTQLDVVRRRPHRPSLPRQRPRRPAQPRNPSRPHRQARRASGPRTPRAGTMTIRTRHISS